MFEAHMNQGNMKPIQYTKCLRGNSNGHCGFKIQTLFQRSIKKIIRSTENCNQNQSIFSNYEWNDKSQLTSKIHQIEKRIEALLGPYFRNFKDDLNKLTDHRKVPQAIIQCNSSPTNLKFYAYTSDESNLMQNAINWFQAFISEQLLIISDELEHQRFQRLKKSIIEVVKEKHMSDHRYSYQISSVNILSKNEIKSTKRQKTEDYENNSLQNLSSPFKDNQNNTTSIEIEIPISCSTKLDDMSNLKDPELDTCIFGAKRFKEFSFQSDEKENINLNNKPQDKLISVKWSREQKKQYKKYNAKI